MCGEDEMFDTIELLITLVRHRSLALARFAAVEAVPGAEEAAQVAIRRVAAVEAVEAAIAGEAV